MSEFALKTRLPRYLRVEQERIEKIAREFGLDFFPTVFEMTNYDQMNELAAFGGFPTRYPHWRFGMEYERLSKSSEYGLSRIYEMVINNNPSYAYLLEGNSLTDQRLVMAHVYGHVDFFKNNYCFRATDIERSSSVVPPFDHTEDYDPNRRWVDRMANHGSIISRDMRRHGVEAVESFIDHCLSLENLIDIWSPFHGHAPTTADQAKPDQPAEVPKLKAKDYMDPYINPEEYLVRQREKMEAAEQEKKQFPYRPQRDVLKFLIEHAPLDDWERNALSVIRSEAYYFVPQMQTKIMNEGWASYWHSRMLTERILDASEIVDYADRNAGVMASAPGQLNPYRLGVELLRHIEERWDRGQFGREWEDCQNLDHKKAWDMQLGLGQKKIFEVRRFHSDVTFIDEFLTPDFVAEKKLYTFGYVEKAGQYQIESRQFKEVKQKMLFQLTNSGNPIIVVSDANFRNRGELLLKHEHHGLDLEQRYSEAALAALVRCWKRPVAIATKIEDKGVLLRHDGTTMSNEAYSL